MKHVFKLAGLFLLILLISFVFSCKKDNPSPPVLGATVVSEVTYTTAVSGGEITDDGGDQITSRGICWNTSVDPTILNNRSIVGGGIGTFTCDLTQLQPNTLYYVKAYATNSAGTGYGNQQTFTTSQITVPVLTTSDITTITQSTATTGGNITDEKGGSVTMRGVCWGTLVNPTTADNKTIDGEGTGIFVSNLTGLIGNTLYYVRAYATNSVGTQYGNQVSFTTSPLMPAITTTLISSITQNTASSGGNVTNDGGSPITVRGVCWNTSHNPTTDDIKTSDGPGIGNFVSSISGLLPNTTYYLRAYATNTFGTGYGDELILKTYTGTVIDIEGNPYYTVTIGSQIWMAENLKTTKYNDSTAITNLAESGTWVAATTGAYCDSYNTPSNSTTYGRLYNWYVVDNNAASKMASNGGKNVCPTGWHVPNDTEWATLTDYLTNIGYGFEGSGSDIAKSMAAKSGWTTYFISGTVGNDQSSNNRSGFTAIPGGFRTFNGTYTANGLYSYLWSSAEYSTTNAYDLGIHYDNGIVFRVNGHKRNGLHVRCLRDD